MTDQEMRSIREQLRHEVYASLNTIETVVVTALDYIAEEAVTFGVDQQYDFRTDSVAARAVDQIGRELDRMADKALRILVVTEVRP